MTNVDTSLVEQIFYIPQGKWKSDVHHHRQLDDFGRPRIKPGAGVLKNRNGFLLMN